MAGGSRVLAPPVKPSWSAGWYRVSAGTDTGTPGAVSEGTTAEGTGTAAGSTSTAAASTGTAAGPAQQQMRSEVGQPMSALSLLSSVNVCIQITRVSLPDTRFLKTYLNSTPTLGT